MSIRNVLSWLSVAFAAAGFVAAPSYAQARKKPPVRPVAASDEEDEEAEYEAEATDEQAEAGEGESAEDDATAQEVTDAEETTEEEPAPKAASKGGSPAESLAKASSLAKTAQTELELQQILRLCEQARAAKPSQKETAYAKTLAAWAHNRRGELLADHAQSVPNATDTQRAAIENKALKEFDTAIKLDATKWKAYHNRGVSNGALGNDQKAIADFDKVIELKPDFHLAYFNRAELRRQSGKFEEAIADYSQAVTLAPDDPMPLVGRAMASAHLGQDESAFSDYTAAVELAPTNVSYRLERAEFAQLLNKWDVASSDYAKTIELQEDCAAAFRGYGWLLATCPQPKFRSAKAAIEATERAVALATDTHELDYRYQDALAAAYANAGRFDSAVKLMDAALANAPQEVAEELTHRKTIYASKQPYRQGIVTHPTTSRVAPATPSMIQPASNLDEPPRKTASKGSIPREDIPSKGKPPANLKAPRSPGRSRTPAGNGPWGDYVR
jgi:tetratricopeptide (TPR) repeat protein